MTPVTIDEYKDAMRDAVCCSCVNFTANKRNRARCVHEDSGQCSVFAKLPEVVDVVSSVNSGSIVPYLEQLRRNVCSKCEHQDEKGVCDIRDDRGPVPTWCMLDVHFNLVVGAIEEVQQRSAVG